MSDPFSADSALREELKRLKQENLRLKAELAATAATPPPPAKAKASVSSASPELESQAKHLRDELTKCKAELHAAVVERDRLKKENDSHNELLNAVAIAASEREQRLRIVCLDLQQRCAEASVRMQWLETELHDATLRASAAPIVPVRSSPPPPPPPPPAQQLPVADMMRVVSQMHGSLEALAGLLGGAMPVTKRAPRQIVALASSTPNLAAEGQDDEASVVQPIAQATETVARTPPASVGAPLAAPRRGRPPKVATSASDGTIRPKKQPRTESANPVPSQPALPAAQPRTYLNASNTAAPQKSLQTHTSTDKVNFSDTPFSDAVKLYTPFGSSVGLLAKELHAHFGGDGDEVVSNLIVYISTAAQSWSAQEHRRHVETYADLLAAMPARDSKSDGTQKRNLTLIEAWIAAAVQFVTRRMDAAHTPQGGDAAQIAAVVGSVHYLLRWVRRLPLETLDKLLPRCGDHGAGGSSEHCRHTLWLFAYALLLSFLKGSQLRPLSATSLRSSTSLPADIEALLTALGALFGDVKREWAPDTGDNVGGSWLITAREQRAGGAVDDDPCESSLLSISIHCIVGDLMTQREVPPAVFCRLCDVIGWSRSTIPVADTIEMLSNVVSNMCRADAVTQSTSFEALFALRLFVLYRGFQTVTDVAAMCVPAAGIVSKRLSDGTLAVLLSLAAMDFGLKDDGDKEWDDVRGVLEEYLSSAPPYVSSGKHPSSMLHSAIEGCVATALLHMASPTTGASDESLSPSSNKKRCVAAAMKWWSTHGAHDVGIQGSLLGMGLSDIMERLVRQ